MSDPRKPIFDAVRAARGRGFDAMEVGDREKRLASVGATDYARETQMAQIHVRLERIDANTTSLKEWAEQGHRH